MRISDWSSDVCSSDLTAVERQFRHDGGRQVGDGGAVERIASVQDRRPARRILGRHLHRQAGRIFAPVPPEAQIRILARGLRVHPESKCGRIVDRVRSEEHTSELQSLMRISYAVFCLKKKTHKHPAQRTIYTTRQEPTIRHDSNIPYSTP